MTEELPDLGDRLCWLDRSTLGCGDVSLQLTAGLNIRPSSDRVVSLFKDREFIHAYVDCLRGRGICSMVEVGVKHGGSALFFWHLLNLQKLSCIELADGAPSLESFIQRSGLADSISTHFGVDQADRHRLQQIMLQDFGSGPLDLVVDDASHIYSPSLATFETLFPRLRPGGLYILEDWRAGLLESRRKKPTGYEPPLHQLVHEILDFTVVNPHVISAVNCYRHFTVMERGPAELPPAGINLAAPGDYVLATG